MKKGGDDILMEMLIGGVTLLWKGGVAVYNVFSSDKATAQRSVEEAKKEFNKQKMDMERRNQEIKKLKEEKMKEK